MTRKKILWQERYQYKHAIQPLHVVQYHNYILSICLTISNSSPLISLTSCHSKTYAWIIIINHPFHNGKLLIKGKLSPVSLIYCGNCSSNTVKATSARPNLLCMCNKVIESTFLNIHIQSIYKSITNSISENYWTMDINLTHIHNVHALEYLYSKIE